MPDENTTTSAPVETSPQQTTETTTQTTAPLQEPTSTEQAGETSLLNTEDKSEGKDTTAPKAPDAYADFKLPDGAKIDSKLLEEATPIFKELGLSQDAAQRLVDFYSKHTGDSIASLQESNRATRAEWVGQSNEWMNANGGKEAIKTNIGNALNQIFSIDGAPDTKAIGEFRKFMDWTYAGDNPYFVRAFATMAKAFNEGKAVQGDGPSKFGQLKPGTGDRPSLAQALYGPDGPRKEPLRNPNGSPQGG